PASPVPSRPASTRADGGSEVSAYLSAASTWLVTASSTAARTAGLAATGVTAAPYPLALRMVPPIQALVTAAGSRTAKAAASAAATARRARLQRAGARPAGWVLAGCMGLVLSTAARRRGAVSPAAYPRRCRPPAGAVFARRNEPLPRGGSPGPP